MNTKEGFCCRKRAVRDTRICRPKYASLEYGLFWTKGHREPADTAEALKLGHRVSFVKEIYIGLVNKISICRNVSPIHEEDFYQLLWMEKSESESRSVMSNSLRVHGLYSLWNCPGQNTGVGNLSLSRGSSQPRDWTQVSHIAGTFFTS